MKNWVPLIVICALLATFLTPDRGSGSSLIKRKVLADFDNGQRKTMVVSYPSYAALSIHQTRGGHRLSTWEYCGPKGMLRCERTLVYGVVFYEAIP